MNKLNKFLKKGMSIVLAIAMLLSMLPTSVFAAVGTTMPLPMGESPTDPLDDGLTWVAGKPVLDCKTVVNHTHEIDSCYELTCEHPTDAHLDICYSEATYQKCDHTDDSEHTGVIQIRDVLTYKVDGLSIDIQWVRTHPAYNTVKAEWDTEYQNSSSWTETGKKIAATLAIWGTDFCYEVPSLSNADLCTHDGLEHALYKGCYELTCDTADGHEHTDACYTVTWTQVADVNNDNIPDSEQAKYTVKFDTNGGTGTYAEQTILTGMTATVPSTNPTKEGHTFTGWYPDITAPITADITFVAQWDVNTYTVTWVNDDGSVLKTDTVAYGETPTYDGTEPTKAADAQYTYTFKGWDKDITEVTGDVTYTATYNSTVNTYTVTWVDEDGTVLETDENVAYGTMPSYDGEEPTKASDADNQYTFASWTPNVSEVTGDKTYTATYSSKALWKVTFQLNNDDGTQVVKVEDGKKVEALAVTYTGYRFDGWFEDAACTVTFDFNTIITKDTTIYAGWTKLHTVTFNGNGVANPDTQIVPDNDKATEPTVSRDGYVFQGWFENEATTAFDFDTEIKNDVTLTAKWGVDSDRDGKEDGSAEDPYWTVTYTYGVDGADEDEAVDVYAQYGNQLDGAAMPKPETDPALAGKLFTGWDAEIADKVTNNVTYNATWVDDGNGNQIDDSKETIKVVVVGNGTATIAGTETVAANATVSYLYDSIVVKSIAIKATPVVTDGISETYVSSIAVGSDAVDFDYVADFSVTYNLSDPSNKTVTVTFTDAGFTYNADPTLPFYNGLSEETLTEKLVYDTVIASPAYDANVKEVKYLAREATEISVVIPDNLPLVGGREISIPLPELWLSVTEDFEVVTEAQRDAIIDKALEDFMSGLNVANLQTKWSALTSTIATELKYYNAHDFGYNPNQLASVQEKLHIVYENAAMHIEGNPVITLTDDRAESAVSGNNATVEYSFFTEADLLAQIAPTITANGANVEGTVTFFPALEDLVNEDAGTYKVDVMFAGDTSYKPSSTTVEVTITKTESSTDVPNVNVQYGEAYDANPVVTNKEGTVVDADTIRFILGLDVADVDLNADGVNGLNGKVQVLLPDSIQQYMGMVGLEDGATVTLAELEAALNSIVEITGDSNEVVNTLKTVLESIKGVTENGDLEITIGGGYPTNTGAYLTGAITADSNYETSFDIGYIIITPDAEQVYLQFNYVDANNIFSKALLETIDLNTSAYDDEAFATLNSDATALVQNLFFGMDANGNVVTTMDPSTLDNGVYTQISFIDDFGNEFYYATPIVRVLVIVPNLENVELVDKDGNAYDTFEYTFDNTQKNLYVQIDGEIVNDKTIRYIGIQTNGQVYNDTVGPVRTGVYVATVIYATYDDAGTLVGVGFDVATLIIKPADATISVTGGTIPYDGEEHTVTVETSSAVLDTEPDVTLISGTVKLNGNVNEVGLDAIEGNVNVDFPAWLDAILSEQFADAYANGVTAGDFVYKINEYKDTLVGYGIPEEALADVIAVLEELPETVTVTFEDDVTYSEVGAYVFLGIVTDPDHMPVMDTGLLVIQKQGLEFALEDTTVTWDGEGHFAVVNNPMNSDYVSIIIDRENNVGTIILEDDLNAVVAILEDALERDLPETIDVAELMAAIDVALTRLEEAEELPVFAENVLITIREELAKLPQNGTIILNGELPSEVGTYEVYAITFSAEYATVISGAVLEIVPVQVKVVVNDASKYYGEEDPAFEYEVKYFDHEGNELTDVETDVTVDITREAGENVGDYAISADVSVADDVHFTVVEVTEDAVLTIKPAEITVTVNDAEKTYGTADPEVEYTFVVNNGVVTESEIGLNFTREDGENVGEYDYVVNYTESDNYKVTVEAGALTIIPAKVTITVQDATKYYGDADPEFTAEIEGTDDTIDFRFTREEGTDVGEYVITVIIIDEPNYEIDIDYGILTINPAEVTIVVNDKNMVVNSDVPALDATVTMVNGNVTDEELGLVLNSDATGKVPGKYAITATYNESANWNVTVTEGTLDVTIGDYVCWNVQTGVYYTHVSLGLDEAVSGQIVQLLVDVGTADSYPDRKERYTIITPGVTLDLQGFTLVSDYVVGLEGSFLTATPNAGKLYVAQENIELSEEGYKNQKGQYVLPIWDPSQECFLFSQFVVNTANDARGLFIDEETETIYFQFKHQATAALNQGLLADGADDNELKIIVRVEWETELGTASEEFVYNAEQVALSTSNTKPHDYTFTLDYTELGIDLDTLKVSGIVVTDSGACAFGQVWTADMDKAA